MASFPYISLSFVALFVSCSHFVLMNDVEFHEVRPKNEIVLIRDSTFHLEYEGLQSCTDMQILNDTLLVIQNRACEDAPYFFNLWSLRSDQYLGSFARQGRGPGEYISPHISRSPTWERFLYFTDNGTCKAYVIDPQEALSHESDYWPDEIGLSGADVSWLPIQRNKQFVATLADEKMVFNTLDIDGECTCSIDVFRNINYYDNATTMSHMLCATSNSDVVAEVLLFFPYINFIDSRTGQVRSYSTHRDYRKWRAVLNKPINMNSIQYYAGLTSSKDYVFATYWGIPLGSIINNDWSSTIHVFDNLGHFVYAIHTSEKVGHITIDSEAKYLYGIDLTEDKIIRYDLGPLRE